MNQTMFLKFILFNQNMFRINHHPSPIVWLWLWLWLLLLLSNKGAQLAKAVFSASSTLLEKSHAKFQFPGVSFKTF